MSKTYKTNPSWVKINNPRTSSEVIEVHDHTKTDCDIEKAHGSKRPFYWQDRYRSCGYTVSYYGYHGGFYPRPAKRSKYFRKMHEGIIRAGWRKAKHDLLKLDQDGVYDYDVRSYQHRHSALWDMF